jgi:hypothetical protein
MREIAICLVRLFDSSGAVRKPPALAWPLALTKWYRCSVDAVFESGNSILGLGGAHADGSSAPCCKTGKAAFIGFLRRSAAPPQLLLPLWDIQYE